MKLIHENPSFYRVQKPSTELHLLRIPVNHGGTVVHLAGSHRHTEVARVLIQSSAVTSLVKLAVCCGSRLSNPLEYCKL